MFALCNIQRKSTRRKKGLKDTKHLLPRISESAKKLLSPINNLVFSDNGNVGIMRIQQYSYFLPGE